MLLSVRSSSDVIWHQISRTPTTFGHNLSHKVSFCFAFFFFAFLWFIMSTVCLDVEQPRSYYVITTWLLVTFRLPTDPIFWDYSKKCIYPNTKTSKVTLDEILSSSPKLNKKFGSRVQLVTMVWLSSPTREKKKQIYKPTKKLCKLENRSNYLVNKTWQTRAKTSKQPRVTSW